MSKKKSNLRINFEYIVVKCFFVFLDVIPLRAAYAISYFLAAVMYCIDGKHRNRTIQHLMHAGMANNRKEAKALTWKNFMFMGRMGVDAFKVNKHIKEDNLEKYVKNLIPESIQKACFSKNKAIILLTPHMGNFMYMANVYAMFAHNDLLSVIRPYDNPKLEKMIQKIQFSARHRSCYQKGAIRGLLSALRKGSAIGMLVDQHAGTSTGVETTFFGQPCRTHTTPAVFHLKTGSPICVVVCRQAKEPGHFEMFMNEPIIFEPTKDRDADIQKIAQMYTTAYEELIRETPEQWFWAHRRWTNINRKRK